MIKKEEQQNLQIELSKTLNSLNLRTIQIQKENLQIQHGFEGRELFWENQKNELDRLTNSLKLDVNDIRKGLFENASYTEKMIYEFRNKVKTDRVDLVKKNIESWKVETFVTQKRFKELLELEMKQNLNK